MPWIAFVYLMGHMAINHIWRQIVDDPSVVDITGVQMVLVTKLTSFCWNVHDGRQPQKDLSETQKYAAIKEMPGLLDYAAYVLFFPSLFVGPACEYMDYKRWIDTTLFDIPPGTDPSKAPPTHKQRRIPRSGTPAMKKAVSGVIWLLLYIIFRGKFDPSLLLKDEFESLPFLRRVFLLHMVGFVARWIYYSVWSLSEGACILTGLGYNGFDPHTGQAHWNHLENVNPVGLETAQNPYLYVGSWNKNTNHWLRSYVYLRVTPKGKKPGFRATLATFVTSAFWHGLYPGYYLTFVLGSVIQVTAKSTFPFCFSCCLRGVPFIAMIGTVLYHHFVFVLTLTNQSITKQTSAVTYVHSSFYQPMNRRVPRTNHCTTHYLGWLHSSPSLLLSFRSLSCVLT